jgi:hypothetical protein
MAFRPCLTCGKKFYGGAEYTYLTYFDGEDRYRFRVVNCKACAADLRNAAAESWDSWRDGNWVVPENDSGGVRLLALEVTGTTAADVGSGSGAGRPINVERPAKIVSERSRSAAS